MLREKRILRGSVGIEKGACALVCGVGGIRTRGEVLMIHPTKAYLVSDRKASLCHSRAGGNPDGCLLNHCKNWIGRAFGLPCSSPAPRSGSRAGCAGMTDGGLNSRRNRFLVRHYLESWIVMIFSLKNAISLKPYVGRFMVLILLLIPSSGLVVIR